MHIDEANLWTIDDVLTHLGEDGINQARERGDWWRQHQPVPNTVERPWLHVFPYGTWKLDRVTGQFEVMCWARPDELFNGESAEDGRRHSTFPVYLAWARAGFIPTVEVVQHVKGYYNSLNRRRLLAARDAGLAQVLVWYNATVMDDPHKGRPRWRVHALGQSYAPMIERYGLDYVQENYA